MNNTDDLGKVLARMRFDFRGEYAKGCSSGYLVNKVNEYIDLISALQSSDLTPEREQSGGDVEESVIDNPKSWVAWKREATRLQAIQSSAPIAVTSAIVMQWHDGLPSKHHGEEWFIAELVDGGRAVLRSLPEEFSYDYTTADETYWKAEKVKRWMQFPDSEYMAPKGAPIAVTDGALSIIQMFLCEVADFEDGSYSSATVHDLLGRLQIALAPPKGAQDGNVS